MKTFKEIYIETDDTVKLTLGYDEKSGKLVINAAYIEQDRGRTTQSSVPTFVFDGAEAELTIGEPHIGKSGKITLGMGNIVLDAAPGIISAGGGQVGGSGQLLLKNRIRNSIIDLNAETATASIGGERTDGTLIIRNAEAEQTVLINGRHGNLELGGGGADGDVTLKNSAGQDTVQMDGNRGSLILGGDNVDGDITIKNASAQNTVLIDGNGASLTLGGNGADGDIVVKNAAGEALLTLIGQHGNMVLGSNGADGDLTLKSSNGENAIVLNGDQGSITAGGVGTNGDIIVKNNNDIETIKITGSNGDIQFLNADFAEEFEIESQVFSSVTPGTVMALNDSGRLIPCNNAYDSKVVGVVAGAGNYQPALVLDRNGGKNRLPVAMIGKVYCQATADDTPIRIGDLLTTSDKTGHAMKASDRQRALGTVIGKALGNLADGDGMIPVLVNLQ